LKRISDKYCINDLAPVKAEVLRRIYAEHVCFNIIFTGFFVRIDANYTLLLALSSSAGGSIIVVETSKAVAIVLARVKTSVGSHLPSTRLSCWRYRCVFFDIIKTFVIELVIVFGFREEEKIFILITFVHNFNFLQCAVSVWKVR